MKANASFCLGRKIMIMHFQYTTICVFLHEDSDFLKNLCHLRKKGGFYSETTVGDEYKCVNLIVFFY